MRKPLGYIPTLKELHFQLDKSPYRGRHRPSVPLFVRRFLARALSAGLAALRELGKHLESARAAVRTLAPARPPKLKLAETMAAEGTLSVRVIRRGAHRAPSSLRMAVRHLTTLRSGTRESVPGRDTARHKGAHRLEDLGHMANPQYLACMQARIVHVQGVLGHLRELGAGPRVHGEPSWRERIRADRSRFAAA